MRKYLLIVAIILASFLPALSQPTTSHVIDSLKNRSLTLNGVERVDCLDLLALTIFRSRMSLSEDPLKKDKDRADSVYKYASLAFDKAKKIDYKKGIAFSLTLLAVPDYLRGIDLRFKKKDESEANQAVEKYLFQAISIAEKARDNETLGFVYMLRYKNYWSLKSEDQGNNVKYAQKSIEYFALAGNIKFEGDMCLWITEDYNDRGFYEEAFEYCNRSLKLNLKALPLAISKEEKENIGWLYWQSLLDMSDIFKTAGDYQSALDYLNKADQFSLANSFSFTQMHNAEIFRLLGNFDSSFYYIKEAVVKSPDNPWLKLSLGENYRLTHNYDSALILFQQALPYYRKITLNERVLIEPLLDIGFAYSGKKEYRAALPYAREGIGYAEKLGTRPEMMRGYELLSEIHHGLRNYDSAYQYILQYMELKDSIKNRQLLFRLTNYKNAAEEAKNEAQIGFLNRDNKLKEGQIKQEAQFKNFLMFGLLGLLLIVFFIFRWLRLKRKNEKLKNEKIQTELQQRTVELEMQALRAQMNPHFIFNCLSSINRFIFKNDNKPASDYLTRFSRLIRMVLMNSSRKLITLEDELEMLRLYLDLERLRFKDAFDYSITTTNIVDAGAVFIPPLLLQPFCENAVWHGLMHKESKGHLNIIISQVINENEKVLHCVIEDDGVGREKAAEMKSKSAESEKSLGLKITTERLALLNQENNFSTFYKIENVLNENNEVAGTRVQLKIRYKETIEEYA